MYDSWNTWAQVAPNTSRLHTSGKLGARNQPQEIPQMHFYKAWQQYRELLSHILRGLSSDSVKEAPSLQFRVLISSCSVLLKIRPTQMETWISW